VDTPIDNTYRFTFPRRVHINLKTTHKSMGIKSMYDISFIRLLKLFCVYKNRIQEVPGQVGYAVNVMYTRVVRAVDNTYKYILCRIVILVHFCLVCVLNTLTLQER
jgi:hypothetical protein